MNISGPAQSCKIEKKDDNENNKGHNFIWFAVAVIIFKIISTESFSMAEQEENESLDLILFRAVFLNISGSAQSFCKV